MTTQALKGCAVDWPASSFCPVTLSKTMHLFADIGLQFNLSQNKMLSLFFFWLSYSVLDSFELPKCWHYRYVYHIYLLSYLKNHWEPTTLKQKAGNTTKCAIEGKSRTELHLQRSFVSGTLLLYLFHQALYHVHMKNSWLHGQVPNNYSHPRAWDLFCMIHLYDPLGLRPEPHKQLWFA